ncbi:MAG: aldo/keto reductase, partial [Treponema sp.]|nr:aldo/keto reductase [Treponema sp.]
MQYRKDRFGNDISTLGYGCMRFTKKGIATDMEKTEAEILRAVELGINYFDTAYIYPGSESSLGQILAKNNLRSKVNIATKLPQYLIRNSDSIEKYFSEQLSRLQTDYIDYYLMHMLTDIDAWNTLKKIGIEEWINEKKSQGKIRQIGFSFHGDSEMFLKILKAYDWDFRQIQY